MRAIFRMFASLAHSAQRVDSAFVNAVRQMVNRQQLSRPQLQAALHAAPLLDVRTLLTLSGATCVNLPQYALHAFANESARGHTLRERIVDALDRGNAVAVCTSAFWP